MAEQGLRELTRTVRGAHIAVHPLYPIEPARPEYAWDSKEDWVLESLAATLAAVHGPVWGRKLDVDNAVPSDTSKIVGATARLVNRVQSLEIEIVKLREVVEDSEASFNTQITVLSSDSFRLIAPIAVVVEHDEDGYTATWPQIDAAGFGVSPSEALASLEGRLEELYVELSEWPPEKLGPAPARWLRLISGVIEPAS